MHEPRSNRILPVPGAGSHVPSLDGLRGLAILIVVVLHFTLLQPQTELESIFLRAAGVGWAGVDLFFVLSGFLITSILLASKHRPAYFRNFFVRRTLRIFPLYYAYLVLIFLVLPALRPAPAEPHHFWLWSYLGNVLMAWQGWEGMPAHTTHLWSLAVEEQFYLLWPLIVYWADESQLIRVCATAVILAIAARLALFLILDSGAAGYVLLPARLDPLAIGGLIAVLARRPDSAARLVRIARPIAVASVASLAAVALWQMRVAPTDTFLPPLALPVQVIGYPAIALLGGAVLIFCLSSPTGSLINRFFTSSFLGALGKYSYAIYLLHVPLRNVLRGYFTQAGGLPTIGGSQLPAQIVIIAVGLGLSYLMALVSWHLFEKHFLSLKDRLAPTRSAPREEPQPLAVTSA